MEAPDLSCFFALRLIWDLSICPKLVCTFDQSRPDSLLHHLIRALLNCACRCVLRTHSRSACKPGSHWAKDTRAHQDRACRRPPSHARGTAECGGYMRTAHHELHWDCARCVYMHTPSLQPELHVGKATHLTDIAMCCSNPLLQRPVLN